MRDDLLAIIKHYGVMPQLKYIHSEYYELDEAILKYKSGNYLGDLNYEENEKKVKDHIAEEISDILVMLKQFQYYYDITDEQIEDIMKFKISRQLERIEGK